MSVCVRAHVRVCASMFECILPNIEVREQPLGVAPPLPPFVDTGIQLKLSTLVESAFTH